MTWPRELMMALTPELAPACYPVVFDHYQADRTLLGLEKDAPEERLIETAKDGGSRRDSAGWVGGLHPLDSRKRSRARIGPKSA